ncbi:ATP-binding cassette domain-containing protein [Salsuginibacillus kocurii]|uniref:ATP-binding cassette domain-containing protein n=1 Tax=Salsuginibacillus kocurii TaxID=427078 RepID=UPI0003A81074|nr:ATP-binding cassette domain-containing protein [Salsuginibacillus kocurii]
MQLELKEVSYFYHEMGAEMKGPAVDAISLTIPPGQWLSVIGHTGSGKSTLVRLLKGLLQPAAGTISLDGDVVASAQQGNILSTIGFVFQRPEHQLFESTVHKDLSFGPKQLGWKKKRIEQAIREALLAVGLHDAYLERAPFHLSGGEKRRVALAGVLAMDPRVLILDEPTAGLDPKGKTEMLQMIDNWRRQTKRTVILVSHHMNDVAEFSDSVALLQNGTLMAHADPVTLFLKQGELLRQAGLNVPDCVKLIKGLEQASGKQIPLRTLQEQHVFTQIKTIFSKQTRHA